MENETLKVIKNRKSVRIFTDEEITEEEKDIIIDGAIQAPTAGNMSLLSIIDVQDQELKDKLAVSCDNQPFIKEAKMILIFVADYQKWYDSFKMYHEDARTPGVGDFMLAASDTLLASENATIAAESLGIGSCFIGDIIEKYEYHQELLNIPKYAVPVAMLVFGHPATSQINRKKPTRFDKKYLVSVNKYEKFDEKKLQAMFDDKAKVDGRLGKDLVENIYRRKWSQPFIEEMTRSMKLWLENFK
ncbi:MAG: nitroreductase family protein [Thomasclavelia sp.]|jgi:FMN reductase (NADPH)|nr:nitroreductase family protein [Thomasclavelia sp.]